MLSSNDWSHLTVSKQICSNAWKKKLPTNYVWKLMIVKLWLLYGIFCNRLSVWKKKRNHVRLKMSLTKRVYIHMYEEDLASNNSKWLICHETKPYQYSDASTFTFGLIPFVKGMNSFIQLWVKSCPYCVSTRMALESNNSRRFIFH